MISAVNMKEIKRKVSSAHFEDGLWDILLGVFIFMLSSPFWVFTAVFFYYVGYFVLKKVRQRVTYPRIGYMKTNGNRKLAIMPLLGIVLFVLPLLVLYPLQLISDAHILDLSTISHTTIPAVIAFVAYRCGVKRWYLYAASTLLIIGLFGWLWPVSLLPTFAVLGAIIMLSGMITLIRFMRNNPKMVMEELNEQA